MKANSIHLCFRGGTQFVELSEADAKVLIRARLNPDKKKAKDHNNNQVAMVAQLELIK